MRSPRFLVALALLVGGCSVARYGLAQQTLSPRGPLVGTSTHPPAPRAASTEPNVQEPAVAPVCLLPETPESDASAGNAPARGSSDEEITRELRVRLLSDPGLSSAARHVAITTRDGVVTVRGQISNVRERSQIQAHAYALRGVARVDNLLHVAE
jgi:hypothetical protein